MTKGYLQIEGYDITRLSDYDGLPIKNKLPIELREKFKTKNQWLEEGMQVKEDAKFYEMHPNAMNKKLCEYFLDTEVKPLDGNLEICANCRFRRLDEGRCPVAGDFVSLRGHCSEWDKKQK